MTTLTRRDFYTTIFAEKFSPCGNYLVTADMYGKIAVFNITQALTVDIAIDCKLPLNIFQAHENSIYCFASTERYLISGGSTEIHGWLWKDILHQKVYRSKYILHLSSWKMLLLITIFYPSFQYSHFLLRMFALIGNPIMDGRL